MRQICSFARVADDGRIICTKIGQGDKEVSAALCLTCPTRQCSCDHLRFSLVKISASPIVVRWNDHIEVWNNEPPRITFLRAACATKIVPLSSSQECLSCELRAGGHGQKRQAYIGVAATERAISSRPAHAA